MTNADTPALALQGLITNPVNPFTGNRISDQEKQVNELHIYANHNPTMNGGQATFPVASWYAVSEDVRDGSNWHFLGEW